MSEERMTEEEEKEFVAKIAAEVQAVEDSGYWDCKCVFEDERIENTSKRMVFHFVPIDCKTEGYYKALREQMEDFHDHPQKLILLHAAILRDQEKYS